MRRVGIHRILIYIASDLGEFLTANLFTPDEMLHKGFAEPSNTRETKSVTILAMTSSFGREGR